MLSSIINSGALSWIIPFDVPPGIEVLLLELVELDDDDVIVVELELLLLETEKLEELELLEVSELDEDELETEKLLLDDELDWE